MGMNVVCPICYYKHSKGTQTCSICGYSVVASNELDLYQNGLLDKELIRWKFHNRCEMEQDVMHQEGGHYIANQISTNSHMDSLDTMDENGHNTRNTTANTADVRLTINISGIVESK